MIVQCDVLVIGGGAAAGRAAMDAHDNGAKVAVVMKGSFGTSGASAFKIAEIAGYNVADGVVDQADSPETHFADIMRAAAGMADPKLAKILAEGSIESLRRLEEMNVPFHKDVNGDYLEVLGCFATKPRMHLISGHAEPIVHEQKKAVLSRNIPVYEWTILTRFLVEDNQIVGAVGFNRDGEQVVFHTKAIVMGTGGAGQLFSYNINPADITGDGYSLGFRAGAELINMEFMQAGPGLIYPCKNMFNSWLWAFHPKVTNGLGEEFIHKYLPDGMTVEQCMNLRSGHYPFSSYDGSQWIDIAIQTEIKEGRGGPHGGVIVDFTNVSEDALPKNARGEELKKSWDITVNWLIENRNLDIRKTPVEIAILGHAINGGLNINEKAETTIRGLFAAGETAGGPHGADRLGGNMILTCQVYGKRAGTFAAEFAKEHTFIDLPLNQIEEENQRLTAIKGVNGTLKPHHIKKQLQEIMWRYVLVTRSEESLTTAIEQLEILREKCRKEIAVTNTRELMHAIEAENLVLVGEIISRVARIRKETRGSHFRVDYQSRNDEEFLYRMAVKLDGEEIKLRKINSDMEWVRSYPYDIVHV
ncbi:FAD-binding protein [Ammoniphilus resinae]|uniref:Succinate dehydrogenase/fumarate reductase flavoprotein subunit n=1 Tax=Ammoniphilus resinae TaxID=861532 RepID=A0ABS4GQV0_9BACL|nr:FAD-binding protein [Ammoniphilus resinae]MBP1932643.1 succinate dehydrogenase/fumarate reductase flavoprotein subunit [Ammoniphilus resinae]